MANEPLDLTDQTVLITGVTGQVALPVALSLAETSRVVGVARFTDEVAGDRLRDAGVDCRRVNLLDPDFDSLPDVDVIINMAVLKTGNIDKDLAGNAEALGLLAHRFHAAKALLHVSSTGVYQPNGHEAMTESAPLGDNHRVIMPTYSMAKIAAEAVARLAARQWGLPTTIARLNVPYGDNGGWPLFHLEMIRGGHPIPVHVNSPSQYNPIHEDDIIASIPHLLAAASTPATIVNWGGQDVVSVEDWSTFLAEQIGAEVSFVETDQTLESVIVDLTKMHDLVGPAGVRWQDGFRRMVAANA